MLRKNPKIIICIIILHAIFLSTCNSQNYNKYIQPDSTQIREYVIKIELDRHIYWNSIIKTDTDTLFAFQKQNSNKIYRYNLSKQTLDSLIIPKPNIHKIHFMRYNNDSSYTLAFDVYYDISDSTFLIDINSNGTIIKNYFLNFPNLNNENYYIYSSEFTENKWYFIFKDRNLLGNYQFVEYNLENNMFRVIGDINSKFDLNKLDSDYIYPQLEILKNNHVGILNTYRSGLTLYDILTHEFKTVSCENSYLDTNFFYSKTSTKYKGFYWSLTFFPSLKVYRRWVQLGYEYAKKQMFVYYDSLFNVIGYQLVPKDFINIKDGVYYSFNKTRNNVILKTYGKLTLDSVPKEDFDFQMQEIFKKYNTVCTINQFDPNVKYNKFIEMFSDSIKDKDFKLLVISGTACPACNIDVYNMILINESFLMQHPKYPMYILLLDTMNVFYEYKDQFLFQNHIFVDKDNFYEILFSQKMNINPIILTVRNRKVKSVVPFDVEDDRNSNFLKALFDFN